MRLSFLITGLLLVTTAVLVPAQEPTPLTPKQLNGEWTGTLILDNSRPQVALVFDVTDSTFAGKVYSDGGLMGPMEDGTRKGNRVHFRVGQLDFTGTVDGSRMAVDLIVYNGSTRKLQLVKTPGSMP